ncbi:MAG: DMT family transporter [Oscillospiraceae bacterium]|nr:DMT family transporter [Oscillospiraceae bacterium]
MEQNERSKAPIFLAAIIGHVFWGFSFLASRTALDRAPVLVLLSHRFLLALLVMSLLLPTRLGGLHLRGKRIFPLVALGLAEPVIYFFGEQYGLLHSTTVFSGVMIALIPVVSTLAAWPILRERPSAGQLIFSLVSVGGVIGIGLMSKSSGRLDWIGVAGLLVAVLSAAAYTLLSRGISRDFSPFERTYTMMAIGAAVFTALALLSCRSDPLAYLRPLSDRSYLLSMLFLALCCSVVSYFLSSYAITGLSVAQITVFANLTTAVSVFAGAVFLREPVGWSGILCCALILLGIYGVQRTAPKDRRPADER